MHSFSIEVILNSLDFSSIVIDPCDVQQLQFNSACVNDLIGKNTIFPFLSTFLGGFLSYLKQLYLIHTVCADLKAMQYLSYLISIPTYMAAYNAKK